MENFKSPYFAASIREFWRRWHISLSTWFRDYVYIPLGGSRVGGLRNAWNLMVTFLLSGLWHGASWTFVAWGGLHGGLQAAEKQIVNVRKVKKESKMFHGIKVVITFFLVSALWVFFRAQSFKDAAYMLIYWYQGLHDPLHWLTSAFSNLGIGLGMGLQLLLMLVILILFDYLSLKKDVIASISKWKLPWRWAMYIGFVILIFFLAPAESAEFIYFDF